MRRKLRGRVKRRWKNWSKSCSTCIPTRKCLSYPHAGRTMLKFRALLTNKSFILMRCPIYRIRIVKACLSKIYLCQLDKKIEHFFLNVRKKSFKYFQQFHCLLFCSSFKYILRQSAFDVTHIRAQDKPTTTVVVASPDTSNESKRLANAEKRRLSTQQLTLR
jgi:hypothetical protein